MKDDIKFYNKKFEGIHTKELAQRLFVKELKRYEQVSKYFEIETTNKCNAKCPMCSIDNFSNREFKDALWMKIIDEMDKHSDFIEKVALFRDGEPLLDNKIEQRVKDLRRIGIKTVSFSTNGKLLTQERGKSLIEAGLNEIMLSTDGITKSTFEKVRKGLKFEQVTKNFVDFIALRDRIKADLRICVRMALQPDNEEELKDWLKFWKSVTKETDSVYAKKVHTWGNQHEEISNRKSDVKNLKPCISPFSTMVIKIDGEVAMCGIDYRNKGEMGNLNNQSIEEVWQSRKFRLLRNKHASRQRNDIPMCVGCQIWDPETKVYQ